MLHRLIKILLLHTNHQTKKYEGKKLEKLLSQVLINGKDMAHKLYEYELEELLDGWKLSVVKPMSSLNVEALNGAGLSKLQRLH